MGAISDFLRADHRDCDGALADAEAAVTRGDWPAAAAATAGFRAATERHLAREEDVLFPAFEQATGGSGGPTAVMREEHAQIRALLPQLSAAVEERDADRLLGLSETLMVLVQQHNMKEEQILYPMTDQVLPGAGELVDRMRDLEVPG